MNVNLPDGWSSELVGEVSRKVAKMEPSSLGRETFTYVDIGSIDNSSHRVVSPQVIQVGDAPGRARQHVEFGDTVFSTVRPYLRNIAWIDESLDGQIASTGFCVLRAGNRLDARFLFFFSVSDALLDQVLPLQRGVSYPAVRDKDVFAARVPLPPIEEQREIVRILEEQFSRLDAAAASIAAVRRKTDQFRRSLADAVFGGHVTGAELSPNKNFGEWENVQLGDLLDDVQPGFASGRHNAEGRGVIHVRPMNISRLGRLDLAETKHVEVSDGHRLQRGDVLFNNTNSPALIGKTALIDSDEELAFSNHMTRLRVKRDLVMPDFLALRLHALWHEGFFQEICSNHVNQASVSSKRLKQVEIRLPSLEQQSEIVDLMNVGHGHVDTTLHNATSVERSLSATRRSLLQAAFTGELTKEWREKNNG